MGGDTEGSEEAQKKKDKEKEKVVEEEEWEGGRRKIIFQTDVLKGLNRKSFCRRRFKNRRKMPF